MAIGEIKLECSESYKPENGNNHGKLNVIGNFPRTYEKVSEKLTAKEH